MNRFKTSKKLWSRLYSEWLAIYWEKNYTWLLPSWYWSDGTEVTLDGERHSGSVSGSHQLMRVQQKTQRCLWRKQKGTWIGWRGHREQGVINQWQMARIRDSHEGCQHIKLKLLNGTHHTQQSLVQGTPSPTTPQWRLRRILKSQDQSEDLAPLRFWDHRRLRGKKTQKENNLWRWEYL